MHWKAITAKTKLEQDKGKVKGIAKRRWLAILNRVVREGLIKKQTCAQRFNGGEGRRHSYPWRKIFPSKGNSWCKGPVAGVYKVAELRRTAEGHEF